VIVPSDTEIVFCVKSLNEISSENKNTSTDQEEINGFGLKIFKKIYRRSRAFYLNQFSSIWLLLNPSEELKKSRNDQINNSISLKNHYVTLAFGSLISSSRFKCAEPKFLFQTNNRSIWKIFFAKYNSYIAINMEHLRFNLKREHIDSHRGVIINIQSIFNIIVHICLRGNLDEYVLQNQGNGMLPLVKKMLTTGFFFFFC
jgi:hypothetical protein